MRVWVTVQTKKVDRRIIRFTTGGFKSLSRKGGSVGILVCVEEDVGSIVFVVTVAG